MKEPLLERPEFTLLREVGLYDPGKTEKENLDIYCKAIAKAGDSLDRGPGEYLTRGEFIQYWIGNT